MWPQIKQLCEKQTRIINNLNNLLLNAKDLESCLSAQILHKNFNIYKNINKGRKVVLVCTGKTSEKYIPIENALHIGVNGAIYLKNIKFDFLFMQDYFNHYPNRESMHDDFINYHNFKCQKFIGIHSSNSSKLQLQLNRLVCRIPLNVTINYDVKQYILSGTFFKWAYDISNMPFGNFIGTVFSALQFITYTNPKEIYLVGCDCGGLHANSTEKFEIAKTQLYSWKLVKKILDRDYNHIKVTSINPVNLKNFFNDMYMD